MKKLMAILIPLLLMGALVLAACAKTSAGNSSGAPSPLTTTIQMNATSFVLRAVQVKVNSPVMLDDTVGGGGIHTLCIGTGTGGTNTCLTAGAGPSALYGAGDTISAGSTTTVTFANTGTYRIICSLHAGMYVDVTVIP
jgi:plastocyanin